MGARRKAGSPAAPTEGNLTSNISTLPTQKLGVGTANGNQQPQDLLVNVRRQLGQLCWAREDSFSSTSKGLKGTMGTGRKDSLLAGHGHSCPEAQHYLTPAFWGRHMEPVDTPGL